MSKLRDFVLDKLPTTSRRHVTETAAIFSKRKRSTESKAAEPVTAENYRDHVRSGSSGESYSLPHIPKWMTACGSVASQFASQLLHLGREPEPPTPTKPQAPEGWIPNTEAEAFCAAAAEALGVTWRPTLANLTDFHRNMSPFRRPAMDKRTFYHENVPLVCFSKEGLLDLCRFKAAQIEPKPESPATSPSPPPRPSLEEQAQERLDMAAARRSPGELVAMENQRFFAARQAEEAAAQQTAKGA